MLSEERVIEIRDQRRLAGVLHLPPPAGRPCPLVVYCPGKNGERFEVHRLAIKLARMLTEQGIGFLRFDYYGLGLSDGHYFEMTTSTKISNVLKACEFVRGLREVDADKLTCLGFSDGARIALMASRRAAVSNILLWSPIFYEFGGNIPGGRMPRFYRHRYFKEQMVMPWAGLWVGMDFYRDLNGIVIENELDDYTGKSLVIYGDDDPLMKEEFERLSTDRYALFAGTQEHRVEVIPGAGHLFNSVPFENRLMQVSSEWLAEQFFGRLVRRGGER